MDFLFNSVEKILRLLEGVCGFDVGLDDFRLLFFQHGARKGSSPAKAGFCLPLSAVFEKFLDCFVLVFGNHGGWSVVLDGRVGVLMKILMIQVCVGLV